MEIEQIKKIIKENTRGFTGYISRVRKAELYYRNQNDILRRRNPLAESHKDKDPDNPLRNADNRISHNWHQLLLNQKASYAMTVPPAFDVDDESLNHDIVVIFGDKYPKIAKDLCINAGNAGMAWLHVWRDPDNDFFKYAVVDSKQIRPVFSKSLDHNLEGVLRIYEDYNEEGDTIIVYEYWNDTECWAYSTKKKDGLEGLDEHRIFSIVQNDEAEETNQFTHDWGAIPFIPFRNNPIEQSDLDPIKALIDVYDKVYSGFVNDIDDIQEIIFVLTNYAGEDKKEFMDDLKRYKMVKVDSEDGEKSGVDTLAIEIPVEARNKLLEITREAIFTNGQGVDPQKNIGTNNSGVALKYMYSLLELKTGMLETEFRVGFAELARFVLKYKGVDPDVQIKQTWTRTSINNDSELADIVAKMAPNTSRENIAKSNPIVEDWEAELANLKKEQEEDIRAVDDYKTGDPDDPEDPEE